MKRAYLLPLLAFIGLGTAIVVIIYSNKPPSVKTQGILQFQPPFKSFVAGSGIVEASTGNISIGTPVSGIAVEIYVKVGDQVNAADPLFKIDDRDIQAQRLTANAKVKEAATALQKPKHRLEHAEQLRQRDLSAISVQDLEVLRDEADQAEAALTMAKAQLEQLKVEIDRHTVRAPFSGEVLQIKMRQGEFVEGSGTAPPLLVLGRDHRLNIRVDVDEQDAIRVKAGTKAVAFVRGHPELMIPLHYEYTEPEMIPKTSFTGKSTERTETRVLQVIYSFERTEVPVYVGQQLDVFIETPESNAGETR